MDETKVPKRKADESGIPHLSHRLHTENITVTITPSESVIPSPTSAPPEKKHKKTKKEKKPKKEKKIKKKEKKEKHPPLAIAQPIHASTPKTLVSEDQQVHDVIQMDEQSELEPGAVAIPQRARIRGPSLNNTTTTITATTALSDIFPEREFCNMPLKKDHMSRPIWVCPDGHIMLETHSPIYKQAYDFLIAIAEPECRATLMHEYQLTPYSLYAAVSVGLNTEDIIAVLNRLSKVEVPRGIEQFIRDCTLSYGKVKLVLQRNRYYVESSHPEILEALLSDATILDAKIKNPVDVTVDTKTGLIISRAPVSVQISGGISASANIDSVLQSDDLQAKLSLDEDDDERIEAIQHEVYSFEIDTARVEHVKKRCVELDFPMLEEYDFKNDTVLPNLNIDLKPTTTVRPYQEKSLSKMFGNGRARSGIIVLPCGAGKSLTGITAACTVKKSCLVLCISAVSVEQWRHQFRLWSNIEDKAISRFTSDQKESFSSVAGITVTTYTMVCFGGKRSKDSLKIMEEIQNREWGLLILDEVHVVPAHMFRKVLTVVHTHCKLGLTATLVREDERIGDLNFLIGPKLYEANWMDLRKAGYIANVQCVEVWCPMTPEFYREYLSTNSLPNTQFLVNFHEQRGDKIIVFSDNIFALKAYAIKMKKPFIYGPTSGTERIRILSQFQRNPNVNTVFISKVGDTAIDLPEANVIIQISSHYGSRRQEAQRLGRILRPKARSTEEFNAFFYSLVSKDTEEMYYSTKRQQYLIDQGYSFKVITELPYKQDELFYGDKESQMELLAQVLAVDEKEGNQEELEVDNDSLEVSKALKPTAKRSAGNAKTLSGASQATYSEFRSSGGILNRPTVKHPLFKKR